MTMYKIRNTETGLYSYGIIDNWYSTRTNETCVKWSKNGKTWTTEKAIKSHLLKCFECHGVPSTWEIVEVQILPTKPVDEWIDQKMLMKILKTVK